MGGDPKTDAGEYINGVPGLAQLIIEEATPLEIARSQIEAYLLRNIAGPMNNWISPVDPNDPELHRMFERGVWIGNIRNYVQMVAEQLAAAPTNRTNPLRIDLQYISRSEITRGVIDSSEELMGILDAYEDAFHEGSLDVIERSLMESGIRAELGRKADGRIWFLQILSRPGVHINTLLRNPALYGPYFTPQEEDPTTGIAVFPTRVDGVHVEVVITNGQVTTQTLVVQ